MYKYRTSREPVIAAELPGLVKESEENNGVLHVDKPEEGLKLPKELEDGNAIQSEGIKTREFVQPSS